MVDYYNSTSSQFVNLLIEKVLPWHKLRFINIEPNVINLEIGSVFVVAVKNQSGWQLHGEVALSDDQSSRFFVERLNAVLSGKKRDEEGNMV